MNDIRILVCDDHAMVRAGICALIQQQPDMSVVGEAVDGDDAIRKTERLSPDVVLLDLSMPARNGLSAIGDIRDASPATQILCVTMHDDPAYVRRAQQAGSSGYLVKSAGDGELVAAIRAVSAGMRHFTPRRLRHVSERYEVQQPELDTLSGREREVLALLARGHTQREIGDMLHLSVKTVQTYRARLTQKLGLATRAELVRFAIASGLLDEALTEN